MIDNIRIGIVSSVDTGSCAVRVKYDDPEMVSGWLPVVQRGVGDYATYDLPNIGDQVLCVHRESGPEEGCCIGAIYSIAQQPPVSGAGLRAIKFGAGSVELDASSATITIDASGGLQITGNVQIIGNVEVDGVVTAAAFVQG